MGFSHSSAGAVRARIMILSATRAVEVHTLRPSMTYPLPAGRARVATRAVSRPASGSVTAKHAFSRPSTSGGRKRRRCSALPNATMGIGPKMFMWIAEQPLMAAPDAATVRIASAASVTPRPAPPASRGMATPSHPAAAIAAWNSCGKVAVRSRSRQYAESNSAHTRPTASTISRRSGAAFALKRRFPPGACASAPPS